MTVGREKEATSSIAPTVALEKALRAKSPSTRVRYAQLGLARVRDPETQSLLLRQLYLGELERGDFVKARVAAEQMIALGFMLDVAHHDAARACQGQGDVDGALAHLRAALDHCPKDRRPFHLSTLGGVLLASDRAAEALVPLREASESSKGTEAALVAGQLALARAAIGSADAELDVAYHALLAHGGAEGYGRYLLGEIAFARGDRTRARLHLEAFLSRVHRARPAAQAALAPEVRRATRTLGRITWN